MSSKLIGGILLVMGTTIGAGMLALPIATAELGFWGSTLLLIVCWAIMTTCAFLFLEVNLWLPPNNNMVSMVGATLGRSGQVVAWVLYLMLLYSIISAYIAGGGDLFHYILNNSNIPISLPLSKILFTGLFGFIVYLGIRAVDYFNRGLMSGKMGALLLLIFLIVPYISQGNLHTGSWAYLASPASISTTVVAFASLMIIPSLRTYFGEDIKSLKKAILIGTFIPLVCYILWDMVIMGVIPLEGTPGLRALAHSSSSNSGLVAALTVILNKEIITIIAKFFTSICMATSFLSVSLSLSDVLSDGLQVAKRGMGNVIVFGATFVPPVLVVLFYPDAFLRGIQYAGLCCFVLMILFPPLMVWRGRYHHELALEAPHQVRGGKFLLGLLVVFATLMIGFGLEGAI